MRRRNGPADPGFGSDSFLDVLSNVVGILIILLVMAGAQLGRAPWADDEAEPDAETAGGAAGLVESAAETPSLDDPGAPPISVSADPPADPPAAVAAELRSLADERSSLEERDAALQGELAELLVRRDDAEAELATVRRGAASEESKLDERKRRIARLQEAVAERRKVLSGLLAEFEESKNSAPAQQTIKHRLTPVSQEVTGDEVHLRLDGGRVSVVPLAELLERVKQLVERRREVAMAHGGYKGVVGPIDGYSLEFIIEARKLSPHEERQYGMREGFSLELSRCVVIPDPNVKGEAAEEALKRSSRFAMALRAAPSGATLTMWTYPDSFGLFRKLQAAGRGEGFLVAGRPMPKGTPIMGDRRLGTRSAAQ